MSPVAERVAGLGLVVGALGQAEVPGAVLLRGVPLQVGVLGLRVGLHLTPVAVEDVLPLLDQRACVRDRGRVDVVAGHARHAATVSAPAARRTPRLIRVWSATPSPAAVSHFELIYDV